MSWSIFRTFKRVNAGGGIDGSSFSSGKFSIEELQAKITRCSKSAGGGCSFENAN
jgi:hypothetical protein